MKASNTYAVVTGASKGLGKAITLELASRGKNLLLLALKGEGLKEFIDNIREYYHVKAEYLEVNFVEPQALNIIAQWLEGYHIDMLVNNVGIGGSEFFDKTAFNYIDNIIQINIRTTSFMTHLLVPELKRHAPAYILNVASMASYSPIAYKTVYPASKAFIYSLSRSLAEELKGTGVSISVVLPGPMKTNPEITRRIEQQGWWVQAGLQSPEELAAIAIKRLYKRHKVIVPGVINKINWILLKVIPAAISIPLVSKAVKHEILKVGNENIEVNGLAMRTISAG